MLCFNSTLLKLKQMSEHNTLPQGPATPSATKKTSPALWILAGIVTLGAGAGLAYSWFTSTAYKVHVDRGAGMSYTALVLPDQELKKMLEREDSLKGWCHENYYKAKHYRFDAGYSTAEECIEKKETVITSRFHITKDYDVIGDNEAYLKRIVNIRKQGW